MVVLYLKFVVEHGYKSAVVNTPGSDNFCILLHHAYTSALDIYLDIWAGKHQTNINVNEIAESKGEDYCIKCFQRQRQVWTFEDVL